ncbi:fasciclin domain-containing protein [Sediminispirochaeta bajacaliforniensis]|uniref:fasciclin domain-containing protein n=1 Tax=Sediminispirochaeta bajacaliforniensis TaxID=148 RepID=UPI00037B71D0|nr:fasciclin domain-containing protein [Sediminispirochaeta bajacaliforniensis]
MKKRIMIIGASIAFLLSAFAVSANDSLTQVMDSNPDFARFAQLINEGDIKALLAENEALTFLVPPNETLEAITAQASDDAEAVDRFLKGHILIGALSYDQLRTSEKVITLGGDTLSVALDSDGRVHIGDLVLTSEKNLGTELISVYSVSGPSDAVEKGEE